MTVPLRQVPGQCFQNLFAVPRPLLAALQFLDNFAPDQPVGQHHIGVDCPDDIAPCLLKDGHDAAEERIGMRRRNVPLRPNHLWYCQDPSP